MIVTIHQPLYFPYVGFFQKMQSAELFVVLDDVKFCKNEFYNRNKFINSQDQLEWFTVPVEKKANSKLIKDVYVAKDFGWKRKLMKQMKMNFNDDFTYIHQSNKIIDIEMKSIEYCRNKLNIVTPIIMASELNIEGTKSQRLVNICKTLNATEYISGPNGRDYLQEDLFGDIRIRYFEPRTPDYYTTLVHLENKQLWQM